MKVKNKKIFEESEVDLFLRPKKYTLFKTSWYFWLDLVTRIYIETVALKRIFAIVTLTEKDEKRVSFFFLKKTFLKIEMSILSLKRIRLITSRHSRKN